MTKNLGQSFKGVGNNNHSSGFVPDPGFYNDREGYLRTDGTWVNPGVDELRQRFNNLVLYLLANGFVLPPEVLEGI